MKRFAVWMIVICMLCALLSGCTAEPQDTISVPTTVLPTTEQVDENGLPVGWIMEDANISGSITVLIPFEGVGLFTSFVEAFEELYPNVDVTIRPYGMSHYNKILPDPYKAVPEGEVDVLIGLGTAAYRMWEEDLYMDLTQRLEDEGIDLVQQWGWDAYKHDGKAYTIPCAGMSYYVAINMGAWNEADLGPLPTEWTWEEYLAACEKMTKRADDGTVEMYGGADFGGVTSFLFPYAQVSGGNRYYDPDGTSSYDNPIVINALVRELQAELEDEIWMPKHTYLFDGYHDHRTAFCTSKLASLVTNSMTQKLHIIQDNGRRSIPQFQTGFAPYPVEEKGQTNYAAGVTPTVHVGIAENAPNETAAWAFVKWMSTYGSGYLCAGGYVPTWKGAKPEKMAEALYGDLDTAAQWVDMESFCRVLGRTDLPIFENTMFHYLKGVTNVLSQKQEIEDIYYGNVGAVDALRTLAKEADAAIVAADPNLWPADDDARTVLYNLMERADALISAGEQITITLGEYSKIYAQNKEWYMENYSDRDEDTFTIRLPNSVAADEFRYLIFLSLLETEYANCLIHEFNIYEPAGWLLIDVLFFNPDYQEEGFDSIQQWYDSFGSVFPEAYVVHCREYIIDCCKDAVLEKVYERDQFVS